MGTVNACVKRSYVSAASLIAIISGFLLALTLFTHGHFHKDEQIEKMLPGIQVMYATSIITVLLVVTGIYGVCKQKKWMLICYVVGMILLSLLLSGIFIEGVAVRPKLSKHLREEYLNLMPLTNASESVRETVNEMQIDLQCCGLDQGYQDWGYNISEECLCVEDAVNPCVAAPRNSSLFEDAESDEPIMIFKEPCVPYLISYMTFFMDVTIGLISGMLLLWIFSVVMGIVILCQLNRKQDTPVVVYTPEAKAGNYLVLTDDSELT